jgi:uncharacterized RDD family membrane protein YckC
MSTGPWFYVDRGQQRGPVATEELASWIQSARLPRDVPVWREGLPQWMAAETLPEITSQIQVLGFFVMGPGGPQGPVDPQVVIDWARAGHIGRETLVWRTGLPDWITAGAVPEIAPYIPAAAAAATPIPRMAPAPAAAPAMPLVPAAAPAAREARPVPDREGPCPLCGDTKKMGPRARVLYEYWICRKCSNALVNRRQLAWILDIVALWIVLFIVAFMVGAAGGAARADVSPVIAVLPWLLYAAWLLKDGFNGHSPGKSMMGLQVVDVDTGQGASFGASFQRNLPMLIPFAPLVAALQMSRGPRLGDGWANTRVVWKKHAGRGPF